MIPSPCGHVGMIPSLCGYSVLHCVAVWQCDILCTCGSVEVRDTVWHTVATSGRLKCHHPPLLRHKHTQSQVAQNATRICFFVCLRSHSYWKTDNLQKSEKFQDRQTNSPNISSLLLKITLRKYVLSDKVYVLVINVSQDDPTPLIGKVSHFKCEAVGTNLEQSSGNSNKCILFRLLFAREFYSLQYESISSTGSCWSWVIPKPTIMMLQNQNQTTRCIWQGISEKAFDFWSQQN